MERKINRLERELASSKEKELLVLGDVVELRKQKQTLEEQLKVQGSECDQIKQALRVLEEKYGSLEEEKNVLAKKAECLEKMICRQAETGSQKQNMQLAQRQKYEETLSGFEGTEKDLQMIRWENEGLKRKIKGLEEMVQREQQLREEIEQMYSKISTQNEEQLKVMKETIEKLQKQAEERDLFEDFIKQQEIEINRNNRENNEDIEMESQYSEKGKEVDRNDQYEEIMQLKEDNMTLSRQIEEIERVSAVKWMNRELEMKLLKEQLRELQQKNELIERENKNLELAQENKECKPDYIEEQDNSSDTIEGVLGKLQAEKKKRISLEETLKDVHAEMKRKQPILRRQNEKWLKLNQDFITVEKKQAELQAELQAKSQQCKTVQQQLLVANESLDTQQSQLVFFKEEIQRLAQQIQQLLLVNFKIKENYVAGLGKEALNSLVEKIKAEKNQQFSLKRVEAVYDMPISSLYTDIQEIVEINMNLTRLISQKR